MRRLEHAAANLCQSADRMYLNYVSRHNLPRLLSGPNQVNQSGDT